MRRITLLAAVLSVMSLLGIALGVPLAGAAHPKQPVDKVTGTYTYLIDENPDNWRVVSLNARGSDPVRGWWRLTASWMEPGASMSGPITCLRTEGTDAWLAGPTTDGDNAVFLWVRDGGTPGWTGDLAFTWGAYPEYTLEDMETLCDNMTGPPFHLIGHEGEPYDWDPFPVVSGNVEVRSAD